MWHCYPINLSKRQWIALKDVYDLGRNDDDNNVFQRLKNEGLFAECGIHLQIYSKENTKVNCNVNKANLRDLIAATGLVISNWIQIVNFSARVTVKFDGWPCKTIGHLFYATSSFVHHFVAIGEFKLELQSGNVQFGSKSTICLAVWPWNLTDDPQKQ